MAIWGKKRGAPPRPGDSGAFWAWWTAGGADAVARALTDRSGGAAIVDLISPRVETIHPELSWELGPGLPGSRHMFTVSAGGNPELRAPARRWLLAAPAPDSTWCFTDCRQASPGATLELQGQRFTASETSMTAQVDASNRSVSVQLFHPGFAAGQALADHAGFLLLDQLLGEAAVETWIAAVEPSVRPLTGARPLTDLPALVAEVSQPPAALDATGANVSWLLLSGEDDGRPLMASVSVPLRPMTSPTFDTYVGVTLGYTERNDGGLPVGDSYQRLNALEDHLSDLISGVGRVVAHQTSAGSRTLHFYVDGDTPATEQLKAGLGGWTESKPRLEVRLDPAWDAVRHLRG